MKTSFIVLIFAIVAVACCQGQQDPAAGGKLTPDQVVAKLTEKYGEGVCINLACKQSCWAGGHKSGYCLNNICTCIL